MCHLAGFASLAVGHVIEDILHGAAVWEVALPHLPIGLLASLTLVCMKQEHKLLLDEFAFLWVGSRCSGAHAWRGSRNHASLLDLRRLLLGHGRQTRSRDIFLVHVELR